MHVDNIIIENDSEEENVTQVFSLELNNSKSGKGQNAVPSDEFMDMSNPKSKRSEIFNVKLKNSAKKKGIFSFGKESPDLLERYGHLMCVKRYLDLSDDMNSSYSNRSFPKNNPFILTYEEYANTLSKLQFSNVFESTLDLINRFDKDFMGELRSIIEIAFQLDKKDPSDLDIKKRDNSVQVVVMIATINTCGNIDMRDFLADEALKSVSFMTVLDAVCELIDYLRDRVTYVK